MQGLTKCTSEIKEFLISNGFEYKLIDLPVYHSVGNVGWQNVNAWVKELGVKQDVERYNPFCKIVFTAPVIRMLRVYSEDDPIVEAGCVDLAALKVAYNRFIGILIVTQKISCNQTIVL